VEPPVGDEAGQDGIAVEPLPDEAIVVRYGEMKDQDLTVSVWAEHDDNGRWGLSVLCQANLTALQLVNMKPLRHRIFRVSTVGAVKGIGLDVLPDDEDAPHAWVLYLEEPSPQDWDNLRAVFGGFEANPHAG